MLCPSRMIGYEPLMLVSGSHPGDDHRPYRLAFYECHRNNIKIIARATESYVKRIYASPPRLKLTAGRQRGSSAHLN